MNDMIVKTKEQEQIEPQNQMEMIPQVRHSTKQRIRGNMYPLCMASTEIAAAFLGILALLGIITIHPAWFCIPILLQISSMNLNIIKKCIYAMRQDITVEEAYINSLQKNCKDKKLGGIK